MPTVTATKTVVGAVTKCHRKGCKETFKASYRGGHWQKYCGPTCKYADWVRHNNRTRKPAEE